MSEDELPEPLQPAFESLSLAGAEPPPAAWDYLVDWEGDEATRGLLDLMKEGGQPAIHAVRILAERGDTEAVGPMIELLLDGDVDKLMRDEITFAFHKYGEAAVDALLDAYDEAREREEADAMLALLEAVFETGVSNRRVSEALAKQVEYDPAVVRRMLPEYERTDEVIELLEERAAEIPELEGSDAPEGDVIQAVWNTIEQLGGEVPAELRRQMRPDLADRDNSEAEHYIKKGRRD